MSIYQHTPGKPRGAFSQALDSYSAQRKFWLPLVNAMSSTTDVASGSQRL
jgi:hypothetical protein